MDDGILFDMYEILEIIRGLFCTRWLFLKSHCQLQEIIHVLFVLLVVRTRTIEFYECSYAISAINESVFSSTGIENK